LHRRFKTQLPELCLLLRDKVFPNSPFSDNESLTGSPTSRSPSPSPNVTHNRNKSLSDDTLRPRSRSLSVSLAEDAQARRAGTNKAKKALNREVSMSRVFKPKPKTKSKTDINGKGNEGDETNRSHSVGQYRHKRRDEGVTLVEATPVKGSSKARSAPLPVTTSRGVKSIRGGLFSKSIDESEEDEEIWDIPSSPDILLLEAGSDGVKES
jgi:hypothetical protein